MALLDSLGLDQIKNPFASNSQEFSNFYETFYNSFLTTANALPINSMWLVTIDPLPKAGTLNRLLMNEDWFEDYNDSITKSQTVQHKTKGILIAQGVKITGDSIEVARKGIKNTGYIQGLVGEGRTPFPVMNISFMENNASFVDYTLRPWQIAVAHRSLKDSSLRQATISVTFLSKTGPRSPLAQRKVVKYYNCCPINIDEEEYNYSGSDMYRLRQIQFAYSRYEVLPVDALLLDLVTQQGGFFSDLVSDLKSELQRQFGANNVGQYINNLTDRAKNFGQNLIAGTAKNIVSNVAGGIQGRIDGAINSIAGDVAQLGTKLTGGITEATKNALDSLVGADNPNTDTPLYKQVATNSSVSNVNSDTPSFTKEKSLTVAPTRPTVINKSKSILSTDTPIHVVKPENLRPAPATVVNTNIEISQNDSVDSTTGVSYTVKPNPTNDEVFGLTLTTPMKLKPNPPMDDVRKGQINHQDVEQKIPTNDVPSTKSINYTIRPINENDVPKRP